MISSRPHLRLENSPKGGAQLHRPMEISADTIERPWTKNAGDWDSPVKKRVSCSRVVGMRQSAPDLGCRARDRGGTLGAAFIGPTTPSSFVDQRRAKSRQGRSTRAALRMPAPFRGLRSKAEGLRAGRCPSQFIASVCACEGAQTRIAATALRPILHLRIRRSAQNGINAHYRRDCGTEDATIGCFVTRSGPDYLGAGIVPSIAALAVVVGERAARDPGRIRRGCIADAGLRAEGEADATHRGLYVWQDDHGALLFATRRYDESIADVLDNRRIARC